MGRPGRTILFVALCLQLAVAAGQAGIAPAEQAALAETKAFLAQAHNPDTRVPGPVGTPIFNEGRFTRLHVAAARGQAAVAKLLLDRGAAINALSDPDGQTPLYYAAAGGHMNVVRLLVAAGADVNTAGKIADTPLHAAARFGLDDAVLYLVAHGAKLRAVDRLGRQPLRDALSWDGGPAVVAMLELGCDANEDGGLGEDGETDAGLARWAARNGHDRITRAMISYRPSVIKDVDDSNSTLLHCAASGGCGPAVRLLLSKGAAVDPTNASGRTPLHNAAIFGHTGALDALLEARANVDLRDSYGDSPLHRAVSNGHLATARLLVAHKANVNAANAAGASPLHLAAKEGREDVVGFLLAQDPNVAARDGGGRTALHEAAIRAEPGVAKAILEAGADAEARDDRETTPLHLAVSNGNLATARLLVAHKANVNAANADGASPLHLAAKGGHEGVVDFLLAQDPNVAARDKTGRTALHEAAGSGEPRVVDMLLQGGCKVDARDKFGGTPLHTAARCNRLEVAELLIRQGADIRAVQTDGSSALHLAAQAGVLEMTRFLIAWKLDPRAVDVRRQTPLHLAAYAGRSADLIRALVAAGADVNARSKSGEMPLDYASEEHPETVRALRLLGGRGTPRPRSYLRPRSRFFGSGYNAYEVIYLIDASRSSPRWLRHAIGEVEGSLAKLALYQYFQILVLADGTPREDYSANGRLMRATPANRKRAVTFLRSLKSGEETRLVPAVRRAVELFQKNDSTKPGRLIYLISDGRLQDRVEALHELPKLRIGMGEQRFYLCTFLFGLQSQCVAKTAHQLALQSSGRFKRIREDTP